MDRSTSHIALLRALNVGGHHKLPMAELAALFSDAGCLNVRTYIQSGNVIFDRQDTANLAEDVAARIAARYGYAVPVIVRSRIEFDAIATSNPFLADGLSPESLHVMFLAGAPSPEHIARLDARRSPPDAFQVRGREIYLHCPNGLADTKLTNVYFEKQLSTASTVRSWKTVMKLLEMSRSG